MRGFLLDIQLEIFQARIFKGFMKQKKKVSKFFKAQKSVQTWLIIERNVLILKFKGKREKRKSEYDLSTRRREVYIGIIIYCLCHTKIM